MTAALLKTSRNKIFKTGKQFLFEFEFQVSRFIGGSLKKQRGMVVIVASPHKVGSTWLFRMIAELGKFTRASVPRKYRDTGTLIIDRDDLSAFFQFIKGRRIYKSHSYPPAYELNISTRIVTIYRDPRDVIISSVFYLANLDPRKGGWGKEFSSLSVSDRILYFIRNGQFALTRLEQWFAFKQAFQIRYEDLLTDCSNQLKKLFSWLEIEVRPSDVDQIIEKHKFEKKSLRKRGIEDRNSFYRKGISGDWKNYFNQESINAFKTEIDGRWNRLLLKMGYEENSAWDL